MGGAVRERPLARPPSRDSRRASVPSLERAAREALQQTSRQQRRGLAANGGAGGTTASKGQRPTGAKRGLASSEQVVQQRLVLRNKVIMYLAFVTKTVLDEHIVSQLKVV